MGQRVRERLMNRSHRDAGAQGFGGVEGAIRARSPRGITHESLLVFKEPEIASRSEVLLNESNHLACGDRT